MGMGAVCRLDLIDLRVVDLESSAPETLDMQLSASESSDSTGWGLADDLVRGIFLRLLVTLWDSDTTELQDSASCAESTLASPTSVGAGSELSGVVFLLVLRRLLRPTFDADTAEEHDSASDTASFSWLTMRGCLLLPLVRITGGSTPDTAEQQDSTSDMSASWVESKGVHGCSGLWSLDALVHLFKEEARGDAGCSLSLLSSWLQASTRAFWVGLSACLAVLLVLRLVEGVACVTEKTVIEKTKNKCSSTSQAFLTCWWCADRHRNITTSNPEGCSSIDFWIKRSISKLC